MPDVMTHVLFGEDCINSLHNEVLKQTLLTNKKVFDLGTQGPDPFFYYRIWPWANSEGINRIGSMIHSHHTQAFFLASLQYLKNRRSDEEKYPILLSYLFGFICHYILDKNAHPFIHYFAGSSKPEDPSTKKYKNYHKKLEILIDTYMLQLKKGVTPLESPPYKVLQINENSLDTIGQFYSHMVQQVHHTSLEPEQVKLGVQDMGKALKFLHDPSGWKVKIVQVLETFIGSKGSYSSAFYPKEIPDIEKHLNLIHQQWCHPCDCTEIFTTSFIDIYEESIEEATLLLENIYKLLFTKTDQEVFESLFENLSFSTGKPCDGDDQLQYFHCTFE